MNIDFSTITPIGLFALLIICFALVIVLLFFIRTIRTFRIKTENATVEMNKNLTQAHKSGINLSRDVVKKQSNLAKNHIQTIAGDLRRMMYSKFNLTGSEKTIACLLVDLLVAELKFQVLNNFTENHIGNTDLEIEKYSKIREREYQAFGRRLFDSYDWTIPEHQLRDVFDEFEDDYLYKKLLTIYKDGKYLEKHLRGSNENNVTQ